MRRTLPALLVLLGAAPAAAATLEVCATCAHTSIQGAVYAAAPGDTVLVHPGLWLGDVSIATPLTLQSTAGSASTTLQGQVAASALSVTAAATGVTVEGFTITPSYNNRGVSVYGAATLRDLAFVSSSATYSFVDGYGLYVEGTAALEDSSFSGLDTSGDGGCAWVGGTLVATGTTFSDCTAESGGALYATGATVDLTGCDFARNTAEGGVVTSGFGGAIFASGTDLIAEGCTFEDSSATGNGGHVYAWWGDTLSLTNSTFTGGEASGGGGVYAWWMGDVALSGNTWDHNTALSPDAGVGGHVALSGCASTAITSDVFTGGEAFHEGGTLWAESGSVSLDGVTVTDSTAGYGGGMFWHGVTDARSTLSLVDCHFEGNSAEEGGALFAKHVRLNDLEPDDLLIQDCTFIRNDALEGGALNITAPRSMSLVRGTFCWNSAYSDGGAVWVGEAPVIGQDTLEVANALFLENVAGGRGSDLFLWAVDVGVHTSTFLASEPDGQGAVYSLSTDLDFQNNLLAHVETSAALYGVGGTGLVRYDAWWLNDVDSGGTLADLSGDSTLHFDVDPRLYQQAPGWACETPRLHPDGATFDSGNPAFYDLDGSRSDMGMHGGPDADPALWVDGDADGWEWIFDCDDADPARAPYLDEYCDGVDEDCDGRVDEEPVDPETFYQDLDGDGFGDPGVPLEACSLPTGYVAVAGDCDDTRDDAHPGGVEVWYDGVDQDCDGASDYDQDRDAYDALGHGGTDCDDGDATVHPAAVDVPDNGRDEDCSGMDSATWVGGGGRGCASPSPAPPWLVLLVIPALRRKR